MTFANESAFVSLHRALASYSGMRSFVLAQDSRIAFEHYRHDVAADSLHDINSVTKTVVGLAVGAALREGALPGLDTRLNRLLPQMREYGGLDRRVQRITLRHLLTMTSGFKWDPSVANHCGLGPCERFLREQSRLRFILSRPFAHTPTS